MASLTTVISSFGCSLCTMPVSRHSCEDPYNNVYINGLYYNLKAVDKAHLYEAEVTYGNWEPTSYATEDSERYFGDVVIPEEVEYEGTTYIVTSIGSRAFQYCSGLKSLTIPESVTSIDDFAFNGCSSLNSITIPNNLSSISESTFVHCTSLISLTIPNSVTSIGQSAFYGCTGLNTLTIGNSVTSIGLSAFYGCIGITSLTIPNSVTSIGGNAFYGCTGLTTLTIGNSVTSIGSAAFSNCIGLSSLTIPNNVTSIQGDAFSGCKNLKTLTIGNGVSSIGLNAFSGCSSLESIYISDLSAWCNIFRGELGSGSVFDRTYHLFLNGEEIVDLVIPNNVTTIRYKAFWGCYKIASVTIPNSVTAIGNEAFGNCLELTDVYCYAVDVPKNVKYMWEEPGYSDPFVGSYINYATLHISESSIDAYKAVPSWNFGTFVALDGSSFHEMTISVGNNGKVTYGTSNITNTSQTFNVKEGSDVTLTLTPNSGYRLSSVTVNDVDKTADVSEGTLLISNVTADMTVAVRFVLDGDVASLTITDAGVATFCSDKDLDFSDVAGVKAYTGAGFITSTGKLVLLEVTDVPAGTGLLVKGAAGSYEIPSKASASIYANLLVGVTSATSLSQTDGGYTNYILGKKSDVVGFYKVDGSGGDLPAGKAYLRIPTSAAGARTTIALDFSGDTSGIDDIGADTTQREAWFDLQGRRMEVAPVKAGLYIRNGKKFIVH